MSNAKTVRKLIYALTDAAAAQDEDRVIRAHQALEYRLDMLYRMVPPVVSAEVGLEPRPI